MSEASNPEHARAITNVGFSCTVWSMGERAGHLDGIGVYTQALWHAMQSLTASQPQKWCFKPYAFGRNQLRLDCGVPQVLAKRFSVSCVLSATLHKPLANSAGLRRELDVLHATDHHIPRIKGVPVIATVMDLIPLLHPEWIRQDLPRLKNWLFTSSIRSADHIITISEHSKQDLIRHLGIAPEQVSVTPLGVEPCYFERIDPQQIDATLHAHNLQPGFFLFVGTLQPRKNLRGILAAFNQLPQEIRRQHKLVVVGRDGWGNEDLLPELRALEARGEGYWLDYLPRQQVMALLQSAAALVFPSLYEGFGLPVIEAFAARCPVITSNMTSLPEVAGEAAWLINPTDSAEIATAMLNVLENQTLRAARIEAGLNRAKTFTWEACAARTLDVYEKVLRQH
ncbi:MULTISPECIES: glycosyltransferase family 4 protein [Gammaproteobacteria]|uniref:glycosyltransferase family 4 protein n=1 Tax=Gammaproteobacteria TaxID=1236 RepID=UPI003A8D0C3E